MKILFLDESGDHNLSVIDPQYPLFVLGGVILDKNYAENELPERMNRFKHEIFGTTDIILHTAEIVRNQNKFSRLIEPEFRKLFYQKLNEMMQSLRYSVVACAIRKDIHLSRYGLAALDPYLLCLDVLVERFGFDLAGPSSGMIIAEQRDTTLDHELELAWLNLKIQGTKYLSATQIKTRINGLNLRAKKENLAGLQLADLVVSPIGRYVLGKQVKDDFRIIQQKFRKGPSEKIDGYGLIILPEK